MLILLALSLGTDPAPAFTVVNKCPQFTVVNRIQLSSDDSSKQPYQTSKVKVSAIGWHVHVCVNGHEWSHSDSSYGDKSAHTCPICGQETVKNAQGSWMPTERNTRIVDAPTIKKDLTVQNSSVQVQTVQSIPVQSYQPQKCTGPNCPQSQSYEPLFQPFGGRFRR